MDVKPEIAQENQVVLSVKVGTTTAASQLCADFARWTENLVYSFAISGKCFVAISLWGVVLDAAGNVYLVTNQRGNLKDCQLNSGCGTVINLSLQTR